MDFGSTGYCFDEFDEKELINIDDIQWSDEDWLVECPNRVPKESLQNWLCGKDNTIGVKTKKSDYHKNIDTRTFTRPKKRYTRPSIEKFNEELYGYGVDNEEESSSSMSSPRKLTDSGISLNGVNQIEAPKPNFDLTQPTSLYFDNILTNAPSIESFQNMSPPSLVNSLCSSTFANLMDSSFIKNDPVLREIRDTDYTESVLMNESEPMFQSMSESVSSLNSDVPENFLKKMSFSETFRRNKYLDTTFNRDELEQELNDSDSPPLERTLTLNKNPDETFKLKTNLDDTFKVIQEPPYENAEENEEKYKQTENINGNKNNIMNVTTTIIDNCINTPESPENNLNSTMTYKRTKTINKEKTTNATTSTPALPQSTRLLSRRDKSANDINRLSYCLENKKDKVNTTFVNEEKRISSLSGSTDSENMDYMSISSSSSKGSNKMLNMDGINAIVEMQERSLQVMSTPRSNVREPHLWDNNMFSPITSGNSDPELSSNSSDKGRITPPHYKPKILGSRLQQVANNIRASHPNLKLMDSNLKGSQTNLQKMNTTTTINTKSNLNTMRYTLKGSYTSLKPISSNLPVAPPLIPPAPLQKQKTRNIDDDTSSSSGGKGDATFARPQQPKNSGLPRPVGTGIPRPMSSRIPAPKSGSRQSLTKPSGYLGRK